MSVCVSVCVCGAVVALIKFYHIKLTKQQTQKTLLSCRHKHKHTQIHDDEFTLTATTTTTQVTMGY